MVSRPLTTMTLQYFTTAVVANHLGIEKRTVKQWIARGIFPQPTYRDEHGTRFFDTDWLRAAKALMQRLNNEISFEDLLEILDGTDVNHSLKKEEENGEA